MFWLKRWVCKAWYGQHTAEPLLWPEGTKTAYVCRWCGTFLYEIDLPHIGLKEL